LSRNVG